MKPNRRPEIKLPIIGWCLVIAIACPGCGGKPTYVHRRFHASFDSSPVLGTTSAGATGQPTQRVDDRYDGNIIPSRWRIGGTEGAPLTEMLFGAAGQFSLEGGFQQWSPGSWHYDSVGARLSITLPKISARGLALFTQNADNSNIISVDTMRKVVVYRYAPDTTYITFAGYNFFPVHDTANNKPRMQ
jgi:hypothetical protein